MVLKTKFNSATGKFSVVIPDGESGKAGDERVLAIAVIMGPDGEK